MRLKERLVIAFAKRIRRRTAKWMNSPVVSQQYTMTSLVDAGKDTLFGKDHDFDKITDYESFKENIPISDYEGLSPYIELIKAGKSNILWPNKPLYFCKTSGTTSGAKYIPLTKESLPNHINSARNALLNYILESGNSEILNGKMIFIQGSPKLENIGGIKTGRLSGIVAHHVPKYLLKNRLPTLETNSIPDWEEKVDAIVEETINENMTLIGGIPSWVQMYFEKLQSKGSGSSIRNIFPNLKLLILGGVNFEPYANRFNQLIGEDIDKIEVYPASEGFFAYQDKLSEKGLLLLLNEGIFYEFIRTDEVSSSNPNRISIQDVELNQNYAIVINSNAGLWGYLIGDTVKFTSLKPYRIIVTGRVKHFISAFGEHVIAEEVEAAISEASKLGNVEVTEFTVAPKVTPESGDLPYHEWFIEFREMPTDLDSFAANLDKLMQEKNIYYRDLITGKVLQPLKIKLVKKEGFVNLMKGQGKLGGQNKVIRLSNDRSYSDKLSEFLQ